MLDGLLLKAIQALSRATKVETVASLFLKIIHLFKAPKTPQL
jgi:hypothetical protein